MFINSFDQLHDRLALLTFSNGAVVLDQMPSARGFNKPQMISDVPQNLPGGSTLMVEGIYRAWDELRAVPTGTQSTLRVLVLFTDGASNGVPGIYPTYAPATPFSLRTFDFPQNPIDPDGQTWNNPQINGVFDPQSGAQQTIGPGPFGIPVPVPTGAQTWDQVPPMRNLPEAPCMPPNTQHIHYRSVGIPTQFALVSPALTVNGVPQMTARPMHNPGAVGYPAGTCPQGLTSIYPADLFNINNAARNVLEIIADDARRDVGGDYPIHIYTIGMSYLIRDLLGTIPEMPEDILKRVANDPTSLDYNGSQLSGKYFYAAQAADVAPAFQGIQNEILRLSR
jgi:hypothetical protein